MDIKLYRCRKCYQVTDEPEIRRSVGTEEFWGTPVRTIDVEEVCPEPKCGGQLTEAAVCCDCLELAAEPGSERCYGCEQEAAEAELEAQMQAAREQPSKDLLSTIKDIARGIFT
jgi:hypothetical protein